MEGKEQRFGIADPRSGRRSRPTRPTASVNSAHDSYTGIGGAVPLANMMTGEVIFGGVGSGLYGMLLFVLLAVFIARPDGRPHARVPGQEDRGARDQARAGRACWSMPLLVLVATALAIATDYGDASIFNPGPHGFSETLYAYASQAQQQRLGVRRLHGLRPAERARQRGRLRDHLRRPAGRPARCSLGRFLPLLAALAVAGSLAGKRVAPAGPGTFRTDTPTFVVLLIVVIIIVARAHLLPRPAPRPHRPGPDHAALLMRRDVITSALAVLVFTRRVRRRLPAGHDRGRPGRVPGQGRRQPRRTGRPGRRLEADRPGLHRPASRDGYFQTAPVGHRLQRRRHLLQQPRARTTPSSATLIESSLDDVPRARAALQPRPTARGRARRRGHHLGLGRRPAHLPGQRPHPGPPDRRACASFRSSASTADRRQHRRPRPRRPRGARRERARAQPRPGHRRPPDDRPQPSALPVRPRRSCGRRSAASCASSTRACRSATR